jgi:sterol desaturase/sphingolipid hydroxylase (fatty acid hydroxylase superfamily)
MEVLQNQVGSYRLVLLGGLLLAIAAEVVWDFAHGRKHYHWRETLANFVVFIGHQFFGKVLFAGAKLAVLDFVYRLSPFQLPRHWAMFLLCFLLVDLVYYLFHWVSHKNRFMWAFHHTHHSSTLYNLSGAYRLNWFGGFINLLFFLPLVLLGFPPGWVVGSLVINLLYQFFLHTQSVGKLGWLEGILNTPSAHRVHHAVDEPYLDKNFGGVLLIWDRLFGTYAPETTPPHYGVTTGPVGHNPLRIVGQGFIEWWRTLPWAKHPTAKF